MASLTLTRMSNEIVSLENCGKFANESLEAWRQQKLATREEKIQDQKQVDFI